MIALALACGFVVGIAFTFGMAGIYNMGRTRGEQDTVVIEIDEDAAWDHPELSHLLQGKAAIKRLQ